MAVVPEALLCQAQSIGMWGLRRTSLSSLLVFECRVKECQKGFRV